MPATSAVPKQGGQEFAGSSSEIFLRHTRTLRRMTCPSPARPSATARPTRRACPAPPTAAAPGAVRQQLCARASYGDPVPVVRALLHRLQTLRGCESLGGSLSAAGQTGALQGSEVQFRTGMTGSSTITAMLLQILAVKLALPSGLPLLRGRSAQGPAGWGMRAAP